MNTAKLSTIVALCGALAASPARAQDISVVPLVPSQPKPEKKPGKKPAPRTQRPEPKKPKPAAVAAPQEKPRPDQLSLRGPVVPLKPGESTTINVKVLDQFSQPIAARIRLTADRGTVTAPVAMNPGQYLATYAAPATVQPGSRATITAEIQGLAKPVGTLSLSFASAEPPPPIASLIAGSDERPEVPPVRIVFKDRAEVRPGQTALLKFRILDKDGQPVPLGGVELRADDGELSEPEEIPGGYAVRYAPGEQHRGEIAIRARAGNRPLQGEGSVLVQASGIVPEKQRLGLDISAFAGGLTNFGEVATPQFELALEYALSKLRLGVLGGFSPAGANQVVEQGGSRKADFSFRIIPLVARAGVVWVVGPVDVSAGGTAGLALVSAEVNAGGATQQFSEKLPNLGLFAGLGVPVGPGSVLFEVRATRIKLDHQDEQVNVKGQLGGLSGALGYKFEL